MKATALSGASTILNTLIGFIKTKALALILGTAGVGVLGQLNGFFLLLANFTSLGNNVGVTRYVASYAADGDKASITRLLSSVRLLVGGFVILCAVVGMLFSRTLAQWLLNDSSYSVYIIIILAGLPFTVLYNFYRSFFTGLLEIRYFVLAGVLSAAIGLLVLLPLVYVAGLNGAIWHITILGVVGFATAALFLQRIIRKHQLAKPSLGHLDRAITGQIITFGAASLTAATALYGANLWVRTMIFNHFGQEQAGIYSAMLQMSSLCIMLVLDSISTYCYPRLSGIQNPKEMVAELNQTMRLTLILITPMIVLFIMFKDLIIILSLSRQFLLASPLIGYQLLGDAFKAVGWSIGVSLLPMKRLKAFALIDVTWSALFVTISAITVPRWGLLGALVAYMSGFIFHVLANYFYARRSINYSLWPSNRMLLALSMAIIIYMTTLFRLTPGHVLLCVMLMAYWSTHAIKGGELQLLLNAVKGKFRS